MANSLIKRNSEYRIRIELSPRMTQTVILRRKKGGKVPTIPPSAAYYNSSINLQYNRCRDSGNKMNPKMS